MASVIAAVDRPALVIAPNKTLAAQLYSEFKSLFPENAVEYFVSYYDYYQPEAYVPHTDTYIEKDSAINEQIDKMRHSATRSVMTRGDVIVIASVSCIYGLGLPGVLRGDDRARRGWRGVPPQRAPAAADRPAVRAQRRGLPPRDVPRPRRRGGAVPRLRGREGPCGSSTTRTGSPGSSTWTPSGGRGSGSCTETVIFPASHYVTPEDQLERAIHGIGEELEGRLAELHAQGKPLEAERLKQRTTYDLEMISQMGFCSGIENYSRHLDGRAPGQPPYTLLDYFPKGFVTFLDESHVTVPQLNGMYNGDRSRKQTLVDFGFRLPSALDNRPLRFEEFNDRVGQVIFVSATPAEYELRESGGAVVEQIIRPTGLVDPRIEVRSARTQVDDLLGEIRKNAAAGERVLVTTLTKRMAEDLTEHYAGQGVRVRYLHSDIDTMERVDILRDLRLGTFDVLVGINLLREGLDLPEVSLVAILDADKEGFLRSARSLVQTFGRAARNVSGRVILYADRETRSMREAMSETGRRRDRQVVYNREHGITPETIRKMIADPIGQVCEADYVTAPAEESLFSSREELAKLLRKLRKEMERAAKKLDFERAADLRDRLLALEKAELSSR